MGDAQLTGAVFSSFHFQQWISAHGYWGIFFLLMLGIFGLPIPDEPLLVLSGYLISRGKLHPAGVFLASFCGSAVGISVSYLLGRQLGLRVISHYGNLVGLSPLGSGLWVLHAWSQAHYGPCRGYLFIRVGPIYPVCLFGRPTLGFNLPVRRVLLCRRLGPDL
jgi:hypothetical protein